jgi:hypothetical protein
MFKIRRKSDGKFSTGGSCPRFTSVGKMWKRPQDLSAHLGLLKRHELQQYYGDCEIIEYHVVEAGPAEPITEWYADVLERREERQADYRRRVEEWRKEQRRNEWEKLNKEFGNG